MKAKIIGVLFLTSVILLSSITFPIAGKAEESSTVQIPDLSKHHIYSNYKFSKEKNVINIGVQPIYLPTGFISEAMKRDTILQKALLELGVEVSFYAFLKGDDVNFFIRRGDIDAGISGDMPVITAAATMDVIIPVLIQQGFTSIIANRPMLISELRGRNIGYAFGSNAHYALLRSLAPDGLNETNVNLIPMEVTQMPEALHAGKVDAFSAWEPIAAITLIKYPESVTIHRYLSSGYMYFTKALLEKHPEAVRQIVASEIRAIQWTQNDKQNLLQASEWTIQAGEILTGWSIELSVEENASLAKEDILGLSSAPIIPRCDLETNGLLYMEFEFLKTLGKIPASSNWEEVRNSFDWQIISMVLSDSKKYSLDEFNYMIE